MSLLSVALVEIPSLITSPPYSGALEFFPNVFTEFTEFSDKNIIILKRLVGSNPLSPV